MSTVERESQTVPTARLVELLAARTPGYWVAGIDIEPEDGCYWEGSAVYAVDEIPMPDYPYASGTAEEDSRRVSEWDDEHCRGHVADTHNYFSIPDEQHDANQRLLALAPVLAEEVLRLRGRLDDLATKSHAADVNDSCVTDEPHNEQGCAACQAGVAWRKAYTAVLDAGADQKGRESNG